MIFHNQTIGKLRLLGLGNFAWGFKVVTKRGGMYLYDASSNRRRSIRRGMTGSPGPERRDGHGRGAGSGRHSKTRLPKTSISGGSFARDPHIDRSSRSEASLFQCRRTDGPQSQLAIIPPGDQLKLTIIIVQVRPTPCSPHKLTNGVLMTHK